VTEPALSRGIILAGAAFSGLLFALAVHMIVQAFGLSVAALWSGDNPVVPLGAAFAWWMTAAGAFGGGFIVANVLSGAASGKLPTWLWFIAVGIGVLALAAAGRAASAPSSTAGGSALLGGVAASVLGAWMAYCGSYLAMRRLLHDAALRGRSHAAQRTEFR
jgi:hypothetical protein